MQEEDTAAVISKRSHLIFQFISCVWGVHVTEGEEREKEGHKTERMSKNTGTFVNGRWMFFRSLFLASGAFMVVSLLFLHGDSFLGHFAQQLTANAPVLEGHLPVCVLGLQMPTTASVLKQF